MLRCLGFALAAAPLAALLLSGCGPGPPRRVNLLLITIDTLRADRLACYGGPPNVGTRICALADAGTRFQWAFSTAPTTAPSIASLLTSLYPGSHRVSQNGASYLDAATRTLAEALRERGYQTAAFVSNPILYRSKQLDQGFDHYDQQMTRRERNRPGFTERHARDATDAALAWARSQASPPWFLWVHYQDPHGPYDPPGAPPARDGDRGRRLPVLRNFSGRGGIPSYQALPGVFTAQAYERRYLAEVRFVDAQVGRLLQGLDALGEPPAVLLTADHGEALGEDGYFFAHGHSVGLDQIRVPLLWRPAPGAAGGGLVAQPVSLIDVAPTLLALVGIDPPASFRGRPLPLEGEEPAPDRVFFAEQGRHAAVVGAGRYYARERDPDATRQWDGRTWGEENPPLPPRTAELAAIERGKSPYRLARDAPPAPQLAEALDQYLAEHPPGPDRRHDRVPEEVREQLEALGYGD